jgi:hypothetical protein
MDAALFFLIAALAVMAVEQLTRTSPSGASLQIVSIKTGMCHCRVVVGRGARCLRQATIHHHHSSKPMIALTCWPSFRPFHLEKSQSKANKSQFSLTFLMMSWRAVL